MDLMFPHHEAEIAQANAAYGHQPCRYWLHNNMITINGKKMGKSLGNFITLDEFFSGNHPALTQAYDPMTIRFFILQAHYRSTLDFSNEALQSAEKGLQRLMQIKPALDKVKAVAGDQVSEGLKKIEEACYAAMDDDFNTADALAAVFELVKFINTSADENSSREYLQNLLERLRTLTDVLGLIVDKEEELLDEEIEKLIEERQAARKERNFALADQIRDELLARGIILEDTREGVKWKKA